MTSLDRRNFLQQTSALVGSLALTSAPTLLGAEASSAASQNEGSTRYVEGTVFHDQNHNGVHDPGEPGIKDVRVSNGRDVVKTDDKGRYRIPVDDDSILFVIKPMGWKSPVNALNLPQFFYIHKPEGSPKQRFPGVAPTGPLPTSVNFGLTPQSEHNKFKVVLFGDPQPRNIREIEYIAHDVVEELIGVEAAFGLSLGDIMFDNLALYDDLNRTVATIGLPWHNVKGNHDMNYDSKDNTHAAETFKRNYGPNYYSFDYGAVHFIILDDVCWEGAGKGGYHGELGEKQLAFVKNDLAFVPKNHLVVLSMHIPLMEVVDKEQLFRLLEDRPNTLSISAHTHVQEHFFLGEKDGWRGAKPHHHLNHSTVCGSWWEGAPDEKGIPHATMSDGAPNGYSMLTFDGSRFSVEFKGARKSPLEQLSIFTPEKIPAADTAKTEVVVNVFAGSEKSTVEMRVGKEGVWAPMKRTPREDPYYLALKAAEVGPAPPPGLRLPDPSVTGHIWTSNLPAGLAKGKALLQIRTTDMFGHSYHMQRVISIV